MDILVTSAAAFSFFLAVLLLPPMVTEIRIIIVKLLGPKIKPFPILTYQSQLALKEAVVLLWILYQS